MARALSIVGVLFIASTSHAQFTITPGGTQDSSGAIGDAGNSTFTSTYIGPSTVFSSFTFNGTLTSVIPATYAAEARINFTNTTSGGGTFYFPSNQFSTFGQITISRTNGGLFWFNQNDQLKSETFESFDDGPGPDSQWTNLSMTFNNSVSATALGSFAQGTSFTFDTGGSNFDTEIALYTADGALVATNDDFIGLQSQINVGQLSAGNYLLVVSGYDSLFGNGFAFGGAGFGNYLLNLNGSNVSSGSTLADQVATFSFSVGAVPEPSALALVALVAAAGCLKCRRRKVVA